MQIDLMVFQESEEHVAAAEKGRDEAKLEVIKAIHATIEEFNTGRNDFTCEPQDDSTTIEFVDGKLSIILWRVDVTFAEGFVVDDAHDKVDRGLSEAIEKEFRVPTEVTTKKIFSNRGNYVRG